MTVLFGSRLHCVHLLLLLLYREKQGRCDFWMLHVFGPVRRAAPTVSEYFLMQLFSSDDGWMDGVATFCVAEGQATHHIALPLPKG